ncbi:MAG: prepilin-type N-terminal cleavage/methylation domain-containing protein [Candidatus Harrisonbacteria bacterium]|nr:prepilin-type N-terminal cleavage/methylation domain-containing protein [Candidatus Harrisonbacteria bacterium]
MKTRKQENKKTTNTRERSENFSIRIITSPIRIIRDYSKGFTIVELLVAVGLFLIVLAIASGAFVQALRSQRATLRLMAANDAASSALEQMTREIRVGRDFALAGQSELRFTNSAGAEVTYRLLNARVLKRVGPSGAFLPITTNTVRVTTLRFALTGERKTDNLQPRVTIALAVGATGRDIEGVTTAVQTTVTPRLLDTP